LLADFRKRYPDIQLHLGVSDRPVDLISDGVDCVIRGGVLADSSLVARRIAELDYITCASASYLKTHGTPSHPKELERGPRLVGYFSSLTSRPFPLIFEKATEQITIATDTAFSVNESTAHLTALLQGRADVLVHGATASQARRPRIVIRQLAATISKRFNWSIRQTGI
jgi:LysR family transcriptional regulator for bpeEF and oprC